MRKAISPPSWLPWISRLGRVLVAGKLPPLPSPQQLAGFDYRIMRGEETKLSLPSSITQHWCLAGYMGRHSLLTPCLGRTPSCWALDFFYFVPAFFLQALLHQLQS